MSRLKQPLSWLDSRTIQTVVALLLVGMFLNVFVSSGYSAPMAIAQLLPGTGNGTSDNFVFQEAYITTPNPNIPPNSWVATPNAVSNLSNRFIESGAWKICNPGCNRRPYASWQNSSGSGFKELTDVSLLAGGWYRYKSYNYGGNNWEAVFCDGQGCRSIAKKDLGVGNLPYVGSGGESSDANVKMGSFTTSNNKAYKNGSYQYWCYTWILSNVNGQVSACDASTHSWTVTYN